MDSLTPWVSVGALNVVPLLSLPSAKHFSFLAATYLVLKDFEEATGLVTQGGRLEDILFLFALVSATIKVRAGANVPRFFFFTF